ncbi:MAG: hypothetical protein PHC66_04025 [Candidatus Nanoarchaeia archaeon]|nr:hypothetical protein [Candidatus Nanoarchaeia archaeon]MDD5239336.1 hypothetical protein [Candidatus Nanoarchaeia archaeon]
MKTNNIPAYFTQDNFEKLVTKITRDKLMVGLVKTIWEFYDLNNKQDQRYLVNRVKYTIRDFHGAVCGELFEKELYGENYLKMDNNDRKNASI